MIAWADSGVRVLGVRVCEEMLRKHLFPPGPDSLALMCGPPGMQVILTSTPDGSLESQCNLAYAAQEVLKVSKYHRDSNVLAKTCRRVAGVLNRLHCVMCRMPAWCT